MEELVVTGSRIRATGLESILPGNTITRETFKDRGFTNVIQAINELPATGNGATAAGTNGGQLASLGAQFVDLLDLGTARTLTLINGRRVVSNNAGTIFVFGNESGAQVDANIIPTTLVERVDSQLVSGAVVYGADAVAGVINYVLVDDYEGAEISLRGGITTRGDQPQGSAEVTAGRNFLNGRANVSGSAQYSRIAPVFTDQREFTTNNRAAVLNPLQGGIRNPNFASAIINVAASNNGAFLRSTDDGQPANVGIPNARTGTFDDGGVIWQTVGTSNASVNQIGPFSGAFNARSVIGNEQLVLGIPGAGNPMGANGNPLSTFAPSTLPAGVSATQVFTAFNVTPPAGATTAQLNTLAANVLQANRPTAREYFAQNPNASLNAFLGTFIAGIPDVANTDAATRAFLPRVAVPLRFNDEGNVETYNFADIDPANPLGTLGTPSGGDSFNNIGFAPLFIDLERYNANLISRYDVTENVRLFNEVLYARVRALSPRNGASGNIVTTATDENAGLIVNVNNPFLDAADRAALAAAGITNNFVLSRTNRDIQGNAPTSGIGETFRTTGGARGDFEVFDRAATWEVSFTFGNSQTTSRQTQIKDVEYALAIDAVRDANGNIVCRAQTQSTLPTNVPGVFQNVVREVGPDGIPRDVLFRPQPTREIVDACRPLNVFGFNQASPEAIEYVLANFENFNESGQRALQTFATYDVVDLPGGTLVVSPQLDIRWEDLTYRTDDLSRQGRGRAASIGQTNAATRTIEYGTEVQLPIFGEDFKFPGMESFVIQGGVRFVRLSGEAATFRNLAGDLVSPRAQGDQELIWSGGGELSSDPRPRIPRQHHTVHPQPQHRRAFSGWAAILLRSAAGPVRPS